MSGGNVVALRDLEKTLRDGIVSISTDVVDKYGNLKVSLNVPSTARQIFDKLENLEEIADMSSPQVTQLIKETEKDDPERLRDLKRQAKSCESLVELIQAIKRIEDQLIILRSKCANKIDYGHAIISCKEYLQDINSLSEEVKTDEGIDMSEPLKNFAAEFSQLNFQCRYTLSAEYENYMKLPKISKHKRDHSNLSIIILKLSDPVEKATLNQNLTTMKMIGQLSERLETWKTLILDIFCEAIVASRDGGEVYRIEHPSPNTLKFMLLGKSKGRKDVSMNVEKVLTSMEKFFAELADALDGLALLDASMKSFVSVIGGCIEEALIKMILTDVIAIAAPVCGSENEDQQLFIQLIQRGEDFVEFMKKLGFFSPSTKLLFKFDVDTIFISRRCFAFVSQANKLIGDNYIETCKVGSGGEKDDQENSLRDAIADYTIMKKQNDKEVAELMKKSRDFLFPAMFALQKCSVSASAVEFAKLVRSIFQLAFESEDEGVRQKLCVTAQNIVRLYVIMSPRKHAEMFNSIPTMAALFYNNCYYIAHSIMTLALDFDSDKVSYRSSKNLLEPILIDCVPRLRDAAADCFEATLLRCRRDLAVYLEDHTAFEKFPANYSTSKSALSNKSASGSESNDGVLSTKGEPKLVQSLAACLMYIRSLARNLRELLNEVVFCKAVGSLISFLLDSLVRHVISTSDIRENDANALSDIFKNVLSATDEIMMYRDKSRVTEFCSREYLRLHEIVFVLGNRMQDIEMRWFSGKGPIAEHLSRDEIVSLIQALFADSKQRSECLKRL